jgi:hypothetical protein
MTDVRPKKAIQMGIITSALCLIVSGCSKAEDPILEPIEVGRFQIVSDPAGTVLKIDTHDGFTDRLVQNPETGAYSWEFVSQAR